MKAGETTTVSARELASLRELADYVGRIPSADVATVMAGHHLQHVRLLANDARRVRKEATT